VIVLECDAFRGLTPIFVRNLTLLTLFAVIG
jgi:hypothetical protein